MKHFKDLRVLPTEEEIEGIQAYNDLTLSSLINSNSHMSTMAQVLCDGHNNDWPYQTLPLERWRDRS